MRVSIKYVGKESYLSLKEIYCNTVLETEEGNKVSICMRDDTIEFNVMNFNKWYRINMQTGTVDEM